MKEYILYLGRISKEKCIPDLIEAYKQIDTDYKLIIAGFLGYGEYEEVIKSLGGKNIKFLPVVKGQKKIDLIKNAKVLVLPSKLEGLSKVLLEAMSLKTCVIARNIPPNRELIVNGSTGYLFTSDLRDKIIKVLNSDTSKIEDRA